MQERLIDSETVKSRIGELCINNDDLFSAKAYERIIGVIETVPTIEAEPVRHWIPCSERLPEKTGYYLVCDSTAEFDNIRGRQDVSKFVIGRHGGHWYGAIRGEYITHWMPLPEPPESEVHEDA